MKKVSDFFRKGNAIPIMLIASAFVGFMTVMGVLLLPESPGVLAQMTLEPTHATLQVGDTFTVDVIVSASVPVNVFAGTLIFDTSTLEVQSIDYNTSIADLWAKEPWYSNGDGTLNFIGGTTHTGGFIGSDKLITIHFKAKTSGAGSLFIKNAQILQHDGLGTNAPLAVPIDALFTVEPKDQPSNLLKQSASPATYKVVPQKPSTDLDGDGKQTFADVSILMLHIGSTNDRYDFNLDGFVDLKDLNIILGAK